MSCLNEFKEEIEDRFLAFLWRQWEQLGLASALVERRDRWVIDPESLLLTTCALGRHDPRLFDEMLDWLLTNAHFVNMPRAKSLRRRFDFGIDDRVLAAVCKTVATADKRLNWRLPCETIPADPEPFFIFRTSGSQGTGFGPEDPIFRAFGFSRGPVEFRHLSQLFNRVMPECLLLRLRALVGVTARPDIVAYLVTHKKAYPSRIAKDTGFSQKNINDALVDMEASGIVHSGEPQGRTKFYFVDERDRYPFLHAARSNSSNPGSIPSWICWPALFAAMLALWRGLTAAINSNSPSAVLAGELMTLHKKLEPNLQHAGFDHCFAELKGVHGESYVNAFQSSVVQLFTALDSHGGGENQS